jgi:hypothetical protein
VVSGAFLPLAFLLLGLELASARVECYWTSSALALCWAASHLAHDAVTRQLLVLVGCIALWPAHHALR